MRSYRGGPGPMGPGGFSLGTCRAKIIYQVFVCRHIARQPAAKIQYERLTYRPRAFSRMLAWITHCRTSISAAFSLWLEKNGLIESVGELSQQGTPIFVATANFESNESFGEIALFPSLIARFALTPQCLHQDCYLTSAYALPSHRNSTLITS